MFHHESSDSRVGGIFEMELKGFEQGRAGNQAVTPGGRVLVIDDEPALLRSYQRILQKYFEVVLVEDGREAVNLLQTDRNFDVIVCDLSMPHLNGAGVYEAVKENAPELLDRIVFCTGGAVTHDLRRWLSRLDNLALEKPVDMHALRATIARVRDDNALIG